MADVVKSENKTVQEKSLVLANLIKMKQGKRRANVEEVEKPRGFDRGLEMDCILGKSGSFEGCRILFVIAVLSCRSRQSGQDSIDAAVPGPVDRL